MRNNFVIYSRNLEHLGIWLRMQLRVRWRANVFCSFCTVCGGGRRTELRQSVGQALNSSNTRRGRRGVSFLATFGEHLWSMSPPNLVVVHKRPNNRSTRLTQTPTAAAIVTPPQCSSTCSCCCCGVAFTHWLNFVPESKYKQTGNFQKFKKKAKGVYLKEVKR